MRTGILIVTGCLFFIGAAFFLRATNVITPDKIEAGNKKEKKEKSKQKKKDKENENKDEDMSGISIVKKIEVPEILKELSALCYIDANRFGTVQDELGSVFIYNSSTEKIEKQIPFAGKGDYEGLAIVKGDAFVLRSDGKIFEIKNYNTKPVVSEYQTHLTAKHDTEGFCYDSKGNRLLLAIKGSEEGNKKYKGIYAFNLSTRSMPSEPVYKIDLNDKVFSGSKNKKGNSGINPSGISINPLNGDIYITEGTKPKLLVLDQAGTIKTLKNLDPADFSQPEGITFSPDGKIFISNEGTKNSGNILEIQAIL